MHFFFLCSSVMLEYSDGQKSCTFFLEFFRGLPGGVGPILELVDFVKWSPPGGGAQKNSRKNVQDFCPSLYMIEQVFKM